MRHAAGLDILVLLLWAALTAISFLVLGDNLASWALAISWGSALGQVRSRSRTRRRYAARNQFDCRVRVPGAATASRRKWMRALATPYPDRITLQLMAGRAGTSDEPVVVRPANFAGLRKATASEFLFRFSPAWRIAAFRGNDGEVLVAAPFLFLAPLTGSASSSVSPDPSPRSQEPGC